MRTLLQAVILGLAIGLSTMNRAPCAQEVRADSVATVVRTDSSNVHLRSFNEASLDRLRSDPDFQYDEQQLDLSWWQRLKQWVKLRLFELFSRDGSQQLLKNVLILLGVAALIYLIVKLLGMDATSLFSRKARTANIPFGEHLENIHEIDFETELQQAIASGNYRLAVRLLYLDCLKKLSDSNRIEWQPAKTNAVYINELEDADIRTSFKRLTRQFEYVWYGDFRINQRHFTQLHTSFQQFDEQLT